MPEHPLLRAMPSGPHVEVDGEALYLGRDCHLVAFIPALLNKVVSNRHCVLRREGESRWMLEDLGSTNGTWIRGNRLNGRTLVHTGDVFALGKTGPTFECFRGFGGIGPEATVSEHRMAADAPTLIDDSPLPFDPLALTIRASEPAPAPTPAPVPSRHAPPDPKPDGSAERPYKVGTTPSVFLRHERTGQEFKVAGYTLVLGRDPAAQIMIRSDEEKHISGRHAEIQFRSDDTVVLRDLDSRNGTWLNDRRIKEDAPLKVGDRILLGAVPTVLLVKRLDR